MVAITFRYIVHIFFLLIPTIASAQVNVDSLLQIWNDESKRDTVRLEALKKVAGDGYLHTHPDSAYYYANILAEFSSNKGYPKYEADAINIQGTSYYHRGDLKEASKHFALSYQKRKDLGDKQGVAGSLNNFGLVSLRQGNFEEAKGYYLESLTTYQGIQDSAGIALSLNNIGSVYRNQGDYDSALEYYFKSLFIREKINDLSGVGFTNNNIGLIHMREGSYDSAVQYLLVGGNILKEINNQRGYAGTMINLANVYNYQGEPSLALEYYEQAMNSMNGIGEKKGVAICLSNMALICRTQGNYIRAIKYMVDGLEMERKIGDKQGEGISLNGIGTLYLEQNDVEHSLPYFEEALSILEGIGDKDNTTIALHNIGNVHMKRNDLDAAKLFFTKALKINQLIEDKAGIANSLNSLGNVYSKSNDLETAEKHYEKSVLLKRSIGLKEGMIPSLVGIALISNRMGRFEKAVVLGSEALEIGNELNMVSGIRDAAESLYYSYKATGNSSKALEMHELFVAMRDSIMSEENQRATIRTEFQHDMDMKDAQIKLLDEESARKAAEARAERNKRLLTLGVSASLIVILFGGAYFVQRNRKQRHQVEITRAELEKKLVENDFLRSQLDPHFIKNALINIDRLLAEGKTEEAQRYNDRFYKLMNLTLDNAREQLIGLDEELEMIEQYLAIESERLGNRLQWSVTTADDVNRAEVEIPPMILQPLVENALKHGADMKTGNGLVKLEVRVENDRILCVVEDNGGGVDLEKMKRSTSHGLRITRERLEMFSKLNLAEAKLDLINIGTGTQAVVSFKI